MTTSKIIDALIAAHEHSSFPLASVLPELQAIDRKDVRPVNLDVATVVSRVLGAAPRILSLRDEILRRAPTADMESLQKLEVYAHALFEAHLRCSSTGETEVELRALAEEGQKLRDVLRCDAAALVKRGMIDARRLESCKGQLGYTALSTELSLLAMNMLSCWSQIENRTAISLAELHRAEAIAQALLFFYGTRAQSSDEAKAASDVRARAFTLLLEKYDEARCVVTYLRWKEGDADKYAPSLFGGKKRTGKRKDDGLQAADTANELASPPEVAAALPIVGEPPAATSHEAPAENASQASNPHLGPHGDPFMH